MDIYICGVFFALGLLAEDPDSKLDSLSGLLDIWLLSLLSWYMVGLVIMHYLKIKEKPEVK